MKKFLFLIFTFVVILCNAQNNTIVNDNSSWAILKEVVCPERPVWTQYVYFDGDSIVAGYSYKKVFSCDDKLHENIKYEGLIREQDKKTYFIIVNSETEYSLYDFSLEEGMVFERYVCLSQDTLSLEVKHSDMVEINGILKKRMQITYAPSSFFDNIVDTWIEDIGSLCGLLHPLHYLCTGELSKLLCYYQGNELIYKHSEYSECYYNNLSSVQTTKIESYYIYPNPVDEILNISCLNNAISRIEIFDITGRNVYNKRFENYSSKYEISVSNLLNGLYFIQIKTEKGQTLSYKFLKN